MKTIKYLIYIIFPLIISCKQLYVLESQENDLVQITSEKKDSTIIHIIKPYKDSIESQMNEILCYTKNDMTKGRPQSTIGNFVSDLCLEYVDADLCVLNNGGLRTSIDKGNITREKIYELMPFDNELVVVELNNDDFIGLINYITSRGGEPFSGINITIDKSGELISFSEDKIKNINKVQVLTSDYLANGGDKMWFFQNKNQKKTGLKVRDAIINYCISKDTIDIKLDKRINIIEDE